MNKRYNSRMRNWFRLGFMLLLLLSLLVFLSSFAFAWTNTTGGDHGGNNWIISSGTIISGNHTNISNFIINTGVTANVTGYDGANYGFLEVHAVNITLNGALNATGRGYGGGGGGGGGARGATNYGPTAGGAGGVGAANGSLGGVGGSTFWKQSIFTVGATCYYSDHFCTGGAGGNGGLGGGIYGGSAGAGGASRSTMCGDSCVGNAGLNGGSGKYCNGITNICDNSLDESVMLGSGGGGGGGGSGGSGYQDEMAPGSGGGAGNFGGGMIKLYASNSLISAGNIYLNGKVSSTGNGLAGTNYYSWGGYASSYDQLTGVSGGNATSVGTSSGGPSYYTTSIPSNIVYYAGSGGAGAGGGLLIKAANVNITGTINNLGGNNNVSNGGTVKIFSCVSSSVNYSKLSYGRIYENSSACALEVCNGFDDDLDGLIDEDGICGCYDASDSIKGAVYPFANVLNTSNVVAYYPFNSNASDISGHGLHGNAVNVNCAVSGKFGNSCNFTGTNSYVEVANNALLNTGGAKTISLWVKSSVSGKPIFSKYRTDTVEDGWAVGMNDPYIKNSANNNFGTSVAVPLNNWTHVAMSWNTSGGVVKLYINGVNVSKSSTISGSFSGNPVNMLFGAVWYGPTNTICGFAGCFFTGQIDDVVIFNKTLSDCEIKKLALGPSACLSGCLCDEDSAFYTASVVSNTSTKLLNGSNAVLTHVSPFWNASIPGASWIWESYYVSNSNISTVARFNQSLSLKSNITKVLSANTTIASDNKYNCTFNSYSFFDPTVNGTTFSNASVVNVASGILNGTNVLLCNVTNSGIIPSTPADNTGGLKFNVSVNYCAKILPLETCNGIDDDGNGLIDENGICGCINTSKQNQVSIENLIFLNNSGLIAYWPFDSVDGSNSTNAVEIISGRNGTVVKSSLVPGIVGDAYNFSTPAGSIYGTENYIVAPTTPFDASWNRGYLAGKNNFTVSFFAKFNSTNSGTFLGEYLFRFDRNPIYTDGSWYLQYASNNLVFNYDRATTLSVPFTPTINKWYSIIVSREGNNFNFYVDGTKLNNFSIGTIPNGDGTIYFGTIQETFLAGGFGCQDSDCPQHYDVDSDFRGSLDEISIWNRTLSDCEIKKLALGPSGCLNICVPKNCTGPDSSNIINGASRIYFSAATAPYGSVCQNETRVCNDGELYGSYTASSCIVLPPSNCTGPDSSNIIHTQNKTYFLQSSVTYGDVCLSETRVCSDGNLTGSYTSPTCAVSVPILNCSVSATDVDSDSISYNYKWYSVDENNGQLVYIVDSNLLSLASIAEYESGKLYVCKVYANDGEENSLVGYKSLSFNKDKTYVPYGNIESEVTQIGAYSPNNKIPREVNVPTKSNFSYESNVDCSNGECGDLNSDVVYTLEDLLPLTPPFNKLFFDEGLFGSLMRKTGSLLFLADSPFNFSTELYAKIYSQYSEVENSTYGNYTIKGDGMMYKYDEKCSAYYTPVFKSYAYVTYKNGSVDIVDADSANEITYSLNIDNIIVKSYLFYYLQTGQVVNVSVDAATIISSSNHVAIDSCNGIADNCLIHNYNSSNYANYPMSSTVTSTFDLTKFNLVVNNSCLLSNIADVDKQFKFRINLGNDPINLTANGFGANICTAGSISQLGIPNYLGLVYAYGNPGNLYSDAGIINVSWNDSGLNNIFNNNSRSSSFKNMFDLTIVNISDIVNLNNISAIKLAKSSSYNDAQFKGLFQGMSVSEVISLPVIVSYTSNSGIVLSKAVSFNLNFSEFNFVYGMCPTSEICGDGVDNDLNGIIDDPLICDDPNHPVDMNLSCYYSLLNSGSSYRYWRNDNKGSVDVQETCYNATGTSVYTGIVDSTRVNFTQLSGSVGGITFLAGIGSAPSQGCSNIVSTSNNKCYQVNTAGTYNVLINVLNGTHNGYNVTYYNSNSLNFIVNANCAFANGESLNVKDSRFEANLDSLNPYHLMTGSSFDVENVSLSCLGGVPADNNELYNKYCLAPHNVKNASDLFDSTKYPDVSFSILSTNNSLLYYSGVGATANVASCRDLTVLTVKSNFELDVSTLSYCSAKLETSVDFALPDVTRRNTYCSASQGDDGNGNAIEYTFIRNHLIAYAKESNSTAAYAYGSNADDVYDFFIHTLNNDEVKLYFNSLTKGFQDYRDSGFDNIEKTITPFSDVFTNESLLGEFLPKIIGFENITSEGNLLPPVVQQSDNKEFNSLYSVKKQYLKNIYSTSNEQLNFTKTSVEFAGNLSKMTKLNLTKVCYAEADKFRLKKGYKLDFELVNACPKLLISIIFDPGFYISLKGDNNYCYVDYKKDDYACCNTENSCVYDGKCYAPNSLMNTTYGVGDNDLLQEQCIIY